VHRNGRILENPEALQGLNRNRQPFRRPLPLRDKAAAPNHRGRQSSTRKGRHEYKVSRAEFEELSRLLRATYTGGGIRYRDPSRGLIIARRFAVGDPALQTTYCASVSPMVLCLNMAQASATIPCQSRIRSDSVKSSRTETVFLSSPTFIGA
jgi:hypothetical protein